MFYQSTALAITVSTETSGSQTYRYRVMAASIEDRRVYGGRHL